MKLMFLLMVMTALLVGMVSCVDAVTKSSTQGIKPVVTSNQKLASRAFDFA